MCLICIEFDKQKMSIREAWRAYGEMAPGMEPKHAKEVREMLEDAEAKEQEQEEETVTP